jgi:hydrogenase expression/formation protein HypC
VTDLERAACRADDHCITCADEAIPMRVAELRDGTAVCTDVDGTAHSVAVDLVADVAVGETVLVHAGVAIGAPL